MRTTSDIFGRDRALIGMVHVGALPGTPRHTKPLADIAADAAQEANLLVDAGFDAILIENMHDVPYLLREVGPEIVAGMTAVGSAVRAAVKVPIGVQILAGANRAALAVAHAIGASFIRVEGFVFAAIADEGFLGEADAGPLLRYRKTIGAEGIAIIADIKKKHTSNTLTADISIGETARAAAFFGADAVVVTGVVTGDPAAGEDLRAVRDAVEIPVIVGSGATPERVPALFESADAVIVGSWCKRDGVWSNEVERERATRIVRARG